MAAQGKKVELRSPVGTRVEGNTSDLLVDGVRYDVYTPTTGNAGRIISAIAKKNTQAEGIVKGTDLFKHINSDELIK